MMMMMMKTGAIETDLPVDNSSVVSVHLHEYHIDVVIGHVISNCVTHCLPKLGHRDPALLLFICPIEILVEHLQFHDRQLLLQLQRYPLFRLF